MSHRLPGVNKRLVDAWRQLRRAYEAIPDGCRPSLDTELWHEVEAEVDRACLADDVDAALGAIDTWLEHGLRVFEEARKAAA